MISSSKKNKKQEKLWFLPRFVSSWHFIYEAEKNKEKTVILLTSCTANGKKAGSWPISKWYGSADMDLFQRIHNTVLSHVLLKKGRHSFTYKEKNSFKIWMQTMSFLVSDKNFYRGFALQKEPDMEIVQINVRTLTIRNSACIIIINRYNCFYFCLNGTYPH